MVAANLECDADGTVTRAAVAVGACSEVAQRLPKLEAALVGQSLTPAVAQIPQAEHLAQLLPISDIRGSAEYRHDAALTLVRRALQELAVE